MEISLNDQSKEYEQIKVICENADFNKHDFAIDLIRLALGEINKTVFISKLGLEAEIQLRVSDRMRKIKWTMAQRGYE